MDFLDIAKRRFSARSYMARKVEREKLERILTAAHVAPTAANRQPVRLLVVESAEGLERLGAAADLYGAPLAIVVCADRSRAWTRPFDGKQSGDIDASILTDHMMLEATELGLGSVWIDYFKPDMLKKAFALPDHLDPVHLLAIGYTAETADPERHARTRIPMEQLVGYEKL